MFIPLWALVPLLLFFALGLSSYSIDCYVAIKGYIMDNHTAPKTIKVRPNHLLSRVANIDPKIKKKCMAQLGKLLQRLKDDDLAYEGVSDAIAYYHVNDCVRPVQLVGLAYLSQEQGVPMDLDLIGTEFSSYKNKQEILLMTNQGVAIIWDWLTDIQRIEVRGLRNGEVPKQD